MKNELSGTDYLDYIDIIEALRGKTYVSFMKRVKNNKCITTGTYTQLGINNIFHAHKYITEEEFIKQQKRLLKAHKSGKRLYISIATIEEKEVSSKRVAIRTDKQANYYFNKLNNLHESGNSIMHLICLLDKYYGLDSALRKNLKQTYNLINKEINDYKDRNFY